MAWIWIMVLKKVVMNVFKNFFHVVSRFKTASLLNLLGLSVAFASFILIMFQVDYEKNYNSCHEHRNRVYRLEWNLDGEGFAAIIARPLIRSLEAAPSLAHMEAIGMFRPIISDRSLLVNEGNEKRGFSAPFVEITPSMLKIFTFRFLEGDEHALDVHGNVILPESLAKVFFGEASAVGKTLIAEDSTVVVTGVYKDFPKNSTLPNYVYYSEDPRLDDLNWTNAQDCAYIMLEDPQWAEGFLASCAPYMNPERYGYADAKAMSEDMDNLFRLNPLEDVFYSNQVRFVFSESGSRQTLWLLICVAFVIVFIAAINFTNFSMSLTPLRIRSINTRKVLGSSVRALRSMLIGEGVMLAFVSYCFGLLLVFSCKGSFIENCVSGGIIMTDHLPVLAVTALLSLFSGFLAGLYPAFFMTSFSTALVLKGSFGLSAKGKQMRFLLLCVQYIASITLLIVSAFMILQNRRMFHASFGYEKDRILTVELSNDVMLSRDAFENELLQTDAIQAVGFSYGYLAAMDDCPTFGRTHEGKSISLNVFLVTPNFMKVLGVPILEGRDFSRSDLQLTNGVFIVNRCAVDQYDLKIGEDIGGEVIGIMPNIVYSSFRRAMAPMAFHLISEKEAFGWSSLLFLKLAYIRVQDGVPMEQAEDQILKVLQRFDAYTPMEIVPLNEPIQKTYAKERNVSSLITLFGLLSMIISLVGIYGLVFFETQYKRKEIGVRKVFGSTVEEIMKQFSRQYLSLIAICSLIAVPLAYVIVDKWIDRFVVRTPIYWWVFAGAFVLIAVIILLTTSFQNYKAASANPIDSLKSE